MNDVLTFKRQINNVDLFLSLHILTTGKPEAAFFYYKNENCATRMLCELTSDFHGIRLRKNKGKESSYEYVHSWQSALIRGNKEAGAILKKITEDRKDTENFLTNVVMQLGFEKE